MIKMILFLLENVPLDNKDIRILKGYNKYPENWKEIKRYIKRQYNG